MIEGRVDTLTGRVSSHIQPVAVAALAVLEVLLRTIGPLVTRILETDLVPVALSFFLSWIAGLAVVPNNVGLILYGYLLYVLAPRVFPSRLRYITERVGFRVLTALLTVLVPFLAFTSLPAWTGQIPIIGLVVIPGYILLVQGRAVLQRESYFIAFANAFLFSADLQKDYEDDPHVQGRTLRFWVVFGLLSAASIIITWILLMVLGVLLILLVFLYPVPELLLVGWVGYRSVMTRSVEPAPGAERRFDLETRIISVAHVTTEGIKGLSALLMAGLGFIVPVIFSYIGLVNASSIDSMVSEFLALSGARQLAAALGVCTIALYGAYGVWYWLRVLSRLPIFLDAWRDSIPTEVKTDRDRDLGTLVARPPGYFGPGVLLIVLLGTMMAFGDWPEDPRIPLVLVLAWVGTVLAIVFSSYRAIVRPPQPPLTDGVALPVAFLVHMLGLWLWVDLGNDMLLLGLLRGSVTPEQLFAALQSGSVLFGLLATFAPLYLFFFDDVFAWRETDTQRRFAYIPYLSVMVVIPGAVGWVTTGLLQAVSIAIALFFTGSIFILLLEDYSVISSWGWSGW